MAKRMVPQVHTGDRFTKTGDPNGRIWEVVDVRIATDGILHARLSIGGHQNGTMTIAAGVLTDRHYWQAFLGDERG
jgi:hypothetical protein